MNIYEKNLDKNKANFVPLTPLTFLTRAKDIYPNYEAIIYEDRRYTWIEIYKRCVKFASALTKIGIKKFFRYSRKKDNYTARFCQIFRRKVKSSKR